MKYKTKTVDGTAYNVEQAITRISSHHVRHSGTRILNLEEIMKPFRVIYKREFCMDWKKSGAFSCLGFFDSLEEAKSIREVSGDLVVHSETLEIVKSPDWLWDWEKENPDCYAQQAIKRGI